MTTQHRVGALALSDLGLHYLEQMKVLLQVAGLSLVAIAKSPDTDYQQGYAQAYGARNTADWLCRRCQKLISRQQTVLTHKRTRKEQDYKI